MFSQFIEKKPIHFARHGVKIILNLVGLYKDVMKLSSDEVNSRLKERLDKIIGKKLTKGILELVSSKK